MTGNTIPGAINTFLSTSLASLSTAPVNALAEDFKLPSVWKANLSVDYKFFGINFGADYLYQPHPPGGGVHRSAIGPQHGIARPAARCPDGRTRYQFPADARAYAGQPPTPTPTS